MCKFHRLFAFAAALLLSTSIWAAETCEQRAFGFIYNKSFILGDGEGMETRNCTENNFSNGDNLYQKAKALADAGKAEDANTTLKKGLEAASWAAEGGQDEYGRVYPRQPQKAICVRPSLEKPFQGLLGNIAQQRADKAEKAGRLVDAIYVHDTACQFAEAARVHVVRVKGAKFNPNGLRAGYAGEEIEFKEAYAYSKAHAFENLRKAVREVAVDRVERFRKIEDKLFAPHMYNPKALAYALEWLPYTDDDGSQKKATMAFAEKRGDTLATDEGCMNMETTLEYYRISGNQTKVKQSIAKANSLGETYEQRGAYPAAAACYEASGNSDKAAKLERMADAKREQKEAEYEKSEKVRQKKFSKEQDDLENELGF